MARETDESGWPVSSTPANGGATGAEFRCSVFNEFSYQGALQYGQADPRVERMIDEIVKTSGLATRNFDVVSSPQVPNAAAWIEGGRRMIGYNPGFLDEMVRRTGTEWAVRSIMAHEVGHHLQGHTLQQGGSRPPIELEADKYSGHVVRRLNGSLEDAQIAMKTLAPPRDSATHPGRDRRLNAIRTGWSQAENGQGTGDGDRHDRRTPVPTPVPTQQIATACCAVVRNVQIPQCPMVLAAIPVGNACACYNVLGIPYFTGVGCR